MFKIFIKWFKRFMLLLFTLLLIGLLIPDDIQMPVSGATNADFNPQSFWFYPWGRSGTHKGVDIFARKGTPIKAASPGIVLYAGQNEMGGKVVLLLGPKWRFHYYAHLDNIRVTSYSLVGKKDIIGAVGDSGNAVGKPPHLHYTIATFLPHFWHWDDSPEGWKKMFYLNPIPHIRN